MMILLAIITTVIILRNVKSKPEFFLIESEDYGQENTNKLVYQSDCQCGKKRHNVDRIVGGNDAIENEFPWIVAIFVGTKRHGQMDWHLHCGGSIIASKWIVTAAHCRYQNYNKTYRRTPEIDEYKVVLGEHDISDINSQKRSQTEKDRTVDMFIIHPGYRNSTKHNDIALLKINKEIDLTINIPVCLPRFQQSFEGDYEVYGWGNLNNTQRLDSGILQKVLVPKINTAVCKKAYWKVDIIITTDMICAGDSKTDSCQGDSGGPLSIKVERYLNHHFLAGVVSFGYECAKERYPGIYTKVSHYVDWIHHIMKKNGGAKFCSYWK